jgi:hypothetical protein
LSIVGNAAAEGGDVARSEVRAADKDAAPAGQYAGAIVDNPPENVDACWTTISVPAALIDPELMMPPEKFKAVLSRIMPGLWIPPPTLTVPALLIPPAKLVPVTTMAEPTALLIRLVLSINIPWLDALMTPESEMLPVMVLALRTAMPVGPGVMVPLLPRVPVKDVWLTVMQAVVPALV